jgi:ABC-2 type transport system ATP-binding protein
MQEEDEVRKHIAIVPQDIATYGNFTPWEYAYYFALLRGLPKNKAGEKAEESLKAVGLWNMRARPCATLSGGEKKRAIIASALSSDAEVLMLDEPTSGLDAVARRNVWSVLRDMVKEGKTILLTTHIMEEAEIISDVVAIINKGVITAVGSLDEIKGKVKQKFRVIVEGNSDVLSGYADIARFGDKFVVYLEDEDEALDLVKKLLKGGKRAEVSPTTLEDVFVKLVGGWENENV